MEWVTDGAVLWSTKFAMRDLSDQRFLLLLLVRLILFSWCALCCPLHLWSSSLFSLFSSSSFSVVIKDGYLQIRVWVPPMHALHLLIFFHLVLVLFFSSSFSFSSLPHLLLFLSRMVYSNSCLSSQMQHTESFKMIRWPSWTSWSCWLKCRSYWRMKRRYRWVWRCDAMWCDRWNAMCEDERPDR